MEVLVEYDYDAQEGDELTLRRGDIIRDVVKKQEGWWEGVLNEKRGLFPDNFVKVLNDGSGQAGVRQQLQQNVKLRKSKTSGRRCRVIFSYHQDHEDELNLNVGDIIDIIGEEEEGWWRGVLNGKEGVFPSNFVEEIRAIVASKNDTGAGDKEHDLTPPGLPVKAAKQYCEVKYAYKAQNDDELTLKVGDIVRIINKDGQDAGWWKGELNDKIGVFPDNFVVVLPAADATPTETTPNTSKSPTTTTTTTANKVAVQRKSLEASPPHNNAHKTSVATTTANPTISSTESKTTPPVPSKKPNLIAGLKKSPSGSASGGSGSAGLFSEIKRKLVDVVDGATGSKNNKTTESENNNATTRVGPSATDEENEFDHVERRPLLHDVRASRAKAPGRRPPTTLFKDDDDVLCLNNNNNSTSHSDYNNVELRSHDNADGPVAANRESLVLSSGDSTDGSAATAEIKPPKLREWEKHKAPWLEEMKLNQAKRTSVSPSSVKTTPPPPDKNLPQQSVSVDASTVTAEASKTNDDLGAGLKPTTAPNIRTKPSPTALKPRIKSSKPTVNHVNSEKTSTAEINAASGDPFACQQKDDESISVVSPKQYAELVERVEFLEKRLLRQQEEFQTALADLKARLQIETDMRIMMQAELERVAQNILQV